MMDLLQGLNDAQRQAVTTTEGCVRVIAGAGSGKTRALSHRFAFLVNELGILPGHILCVTFTNKSAAEMRRRIHNLTGDNDTGYVNTFHGFCVSVLQEDSHAVQSLALYLAQFRLPLVASAPAEMELSRDRQHGLAFVCKIFARRAVIGRDVAECEIRSVRILRGLRGVHLNGLRYSRHIRFRNSESLSLCCRRPMWCGVRIPALRGLCRCRRDRS